MNDVTIVGGGPTGLMLAGELALAGVDVVVVERRSIPDLVGTRARGFHSRTIEIFDQRGIADRFLVEGRTVQVLSFANTALEVTSLPSRHPYTLGLSQSHIERILRGWVEELEVPIHPGLEVTGFAQDDAGVDVHFAEGDLLRTAYLVGADGGRSVIRTAAGIEFVGAEATRSHLIAEVEVTEETPTGIRYDDVGIHGINVMEDGRTVGSSRPSHGSAPPPSPRSQTSAKHLRPCTARTSGSTIPCGSRGSPMPPGKQPPTAVGGCYSPETPRTSIHLPAGRGIGLGVQDAVNLGWKLAQVVQGVSPEALLDTYHAERHLATARVVRNVMAQALLQRGDARTEATRDPIAEMLSFDGPRTQLAGLLSGLDVVYDLGEGHPLLGRRMPDLDLATPHGPQRVFELLHDARPVLFNLGEPGSIDITQWADRIQQVDADHTGTWVLPVIGTVTAPTAVLIRPDGHVAWVGDGTQTGLSEALTTWFGPPANAGAA